MNNINNNSCYSCQHFNVCAYKTRFQNSITELKKTLKVEDPVIISTNCKYFSRDFYGGYQDADGEKKDHE